MKVNNKGPHSTAVAFSKQSVCQPKTSASPRDGAVSMSVSMAAELCVGLEDPQPS